MNLSPQLIKKQSALPHHGKRKDMKKENLNTANNEVEKAYELINDLVSNHGLDMIDLTYPNPDGVQDADVVSDMMLLRQSANSLSKACNILVKKLTDIIGDEN